MPPMQVSRREPFFCVFWRHLALKNLRRHRILRKWWITLIILSFFQVWRLQHTLSTLSSINSPPTIFSVKHIRSYLWYPHRVKSKAESLSTSCSATTRLPWQPGDLTWILLFCLWSFLSRFRFSVPPTWRAVARWLHLFGGLFGFGHWKLRWVQTSDLWPPCSNSTSPLLRSFARFRTSSPLPLPRSLLHILTPHLNLFPHKATGGFLYRK